MLFLLLVLLILTHLLKLSPLLHIPACLLFYSNTHTHIQFDEVNGQIQFEPRIHISVVFDCAPSRPISNISDSNILHPVEIITDTILNDRSILTRGKRGICKKNCLISIYHILHLILSSLLYLLKILSLVSGFLSLNDKIQMALLLDIKLILL